MSISHLILTYSHQIKNFVMIFYETHDLYIAEETKNPYDWIDC